MKYIGYFLLVNTLFVVSCSENEKPKKETSTVEKVDSVKVFTLKTEQLAKSIILPAELLPLERVEIHSKVDGYVSKINVDIGSIVHKGQTLAIIDAPEMKSQLADLYEKTQSAKARLMSSTDTYNRLTTAAKVSGAIAEGELAKAKSQIMADKAVYQSSQYSASAFKNIKGNLIIIAPFSGVVTKRNIDQGSLVGKDNLPMMEIENNSKLRLRVAVPEAVSSSTIKNDSITFTTRALPGKTYAGKLVRKSGSLDMATRSETWEFLIDNLKKELKSGMFADAKLNITRPQPSLVVPPSAIATTLEKKFVIKISNGKTQWADVAQGLNFTDKVEVFGKLNEGDTIVAKGTDELKPDKKYLSNFK